MTDDAREPGPRAAAFVEPPEYASLDRAQLIGMVEEGKRAQAKLEQISLDLVTRTIEAESAIRAQNRFLSSVTHELRSPLHTILGYIRLVIGECEGETRRQLEIAERSGHQLLRLVNDLLEFNSLESKAISLQPEPMSLSALLDRVTTSAERFASMTNARFAINLGPGLPDEIEADEHRLFQVLDNLTGNACKYTHDGIVELSVTSSEAGPTRPRESALRRLDFSVRDTGIGIPAEEIGAIFLPFARGSNTAGYSGIGLGLAIARQWVEAMGGRLTVESTPGAGSLFRFSITVTVVAPSILPGSPATETDAMHLLERPRLSSDQAVEFCELVARGRVIKLAEWADSHAQLPGADVSLLRNIAQLARGADLLSLRRLASQLNNEET